MNRTGRARADVTTLAATLLPVALVSVVTVAGCLTTGTRGTAGRDADGVPAQSPGVTGSEGPSGPPQCPSFVPPTPTPAPTFAVYTVSRGDNLNSVAKKYATTARSLAFWNRATHPSLDPESAGYAPDRLQVGWTLLLIPGLVYDEETGDPVLPSGAVPAP
jgi:hypothetical protein